LENYLQKGLKIAISGKGGVGKTTFCAVLSHLLARDGHQILSIDADSNPTLGGALGLSGDDSPQPLIEMKELIQERTEARPDAVGQYFKLNPNVSDIPEKYWQEVDGIKLLVLGGIEDPGRGCACPEAAFLKALLTYTILQREEMILVDLAAGVEFLGRACVQGVDGLVVVVEPGARSIETALNIVEMAGEMGITRVGAFANKVTDGGQLEIIQEQLGKIEILGSYRHDPALQRADLERKPVINASEELVEEIKKAKTKLMEILAVKT
jgi:CO dehydrogenase maturation factor